MTSKVYILIDDSERIIKIDGGYTIGNINELENWILIDEGYGDRYNLCQSNYLPKSLYEEHGVPQYKFVDEEIVERTQEEIQQDIDDLIRPQPTQLDRIEAQVLYTALITDSVLEV